MFRTIARIVAASAAANVMMNTVNTWPSIRSGDPNRLKATKFSAAALSMSSRPQSTAMALRRVKTTATPSANMSAATTR